MMIPCSLVKRGLRSEGSFTPDYNSRRIIFIAILTWNHEDAIDVVTTIPRLDNNSSCENTVT